MSTPISFTKRHSKRYKSRTNPQILKMRAESSNRSNDINEKYSKMLDDYGQKYIYNNGRKSSKKFQDDEPDDESAESEGEE